MKRQHSISFFYAAMLVLCWYIPACQALGPLTAIFNQEWDTGPSFTKQVEKNIEELQHRKTEANAGQQTYKAALDGVIKTIAALKERAQRVRGTDLEYTNQQLVITNLTGQVLSEIGQVYHDIKNTLDAHIKLLQEYKADPEFKNKGFQPEQKSIYSIDDFQRISAVILKSESELKDLEDRLKKISADHDTLKKNQALARQEYEEKKREQKRTEDKRNC